MISPKHTGRRPGPNTTRGTIEDVARKHFAERGYDRTSVRQVAIEAGVEYRVGGWGFPHGDEGGGAWIGLEAVRRTLHWLDGRDSPCPLLEAVYDRFDRNLNQFVSWANSAGATEFAQITPLVIEHVERRTPLALTLIQAAAREIDRLGRALAARSKTVLPCSLLGGLARFMEPWLEEALRARLTPCDQDSVQGALLMIRRAAEGRADAKPGEQT